MVKDIVILDFGTLTHNKKQKRR